MNDLDPKKISFLPLFLVLQHEILSHFFKEYQYMKDLHQTFIKPVKKCLVVLLNDKRPNSTFLPFSCSVTTQGDEILLYTIV